MVWQLWKTIWRFLKKLKIRFSSPISGYIPERIGSRVSRDTCTPMFIAALFTVAKRRKQLKCPLMDEWNKVWYIHTMEYYSALKRKEILKHITTWVNFKDIMLSKLSQSQRYAIWFHLHEVPRVAQFIETDSKRMVVRGLGEEGVGNVI